MFNLELCIWLLNVQDIEKCSSSERDCGEGYFCNSCPMRFKGSRCVRSTTSNPFKLLVSLSLSLIFFLHSLWNSFWLTIWSLKALNYDYFLLQNNSLPFNRYAYLTTHNSFAIRKGSSSNSNPNPNPTGDPRVTFINQEDSITHQLCVRSIAKHTNQSFKDTRIVNSILKSRGNQYASILLSWSLSRLKYWLHDF